MWHSPSIECRLCRRSSAAYTWIVGEIEQQVGRVLAAAAEELRAEGIAPEALAEYVPARRKLFIQRPATMRPLGEVWRLGTLLLGPPPNSHTTPTLWASRHTTRSAVRPHPGNQSISREERRDIAAAALRGGYAEGTPVNFDAVSIPFDEASLRTLGVDSPVGLVGVEVRVRWRAGATLDGAPTLEAYLAERIGLLIEGRNPA